MNQNVRVTTEIWLVAIGILGLLALLGLAVNYLFGGWGLVCVAVVLVLAVLWLAIYADIAKPSGGVHG